MKGTWRPDKREIEGAVGSIPAGVKLDELVAALGVAVEWHRKDSELSRLQYWQRARELTESQPFAELQKLVQNIASFEFEADPGLLSLIANLRHFSARSRFESMRHGTRGRKGLLYSGVMRAWTDAGGTLGKSEIGPLPRLLCFVAKKLDFQLRPRGAKEVIARELKRRGRLKELNAPVTSKAKLRSHGEAAAQAAAQAAIAARMASGRRKE